MITIKSLEKMHMGIFNKAKNICVILQVLSSLCYISMAIVHRDEIAATVDFLPLPTAILIVLKCMFFFAFVVGGSYYVCSITIGSLYFFAHVIYQIKMLNLLVKNIPYGLDNGRDVQDQIRQRIIFCMGQDLRIRR